MQDWRKRTKAKMIEICGHKCNLCGYDKCPSALEYHHLDPNTKDFALAGGGITRRLVDMIDELRKCIMVCANCHREIHAGLVDLDTLYQHQIHDEVAINRYTVDIDESKAAAQATKSALKQAKQQFISDWNEQNPHTDHRIKKVDWSQHDVFQLIKEYKSYEAVGRVLGVTGAAVKRRIKHLEPK